MSEDEARRLALKWRDEWDHRLPNLVIRDVDFIAAKLAPILAERDDLRVRLDATTSHNLAILNDRDQRIVELEAEVAALKQHAAASDAALDAILSGERVKMHWDGEGWREGRFGFAVDFVRLPEGEK